MNLMPEILKMLGLEVEEKFNFESKFGMIRGIRFDKNYHLVAKNGNCIDEDIKYILRDSGKVIKLPWKPKSEDTGFIVYANGEIGSKTFRPESTHDTALIFMGNCFRTRGDAEAHKEEILEKMRKAWEE